jgi:hypothetical protein
MLNGYKTYIVALATLVFAALGWWLGKIEPDAAIQLAVTAISAATIRHGVSTSSNGGFR